MTQNNINGYISLRMQSMYILLSKVNGHFICFLLLFSIFGPKINCLNVNQSDSFFIKCFRLLSELVENHFLFIVATPSSEIHQWKNHVTWPGFKSKCTVCGSGLLTAMLAIGRCRIKFQASHVIFSWWISLLGVKIVTSEWYCIIHLLMQYKEIFHGCNAI
jgi:hypothetical protein